MFGQTDSAWRNWVHRWTAEEGRHAIVLRDYLVVTRNVDPVALERGRMQIMEDGYETNEKDTLRGMAYVAFQELATRISHRNTGRYSGDPVADRIMARISADENLHMVFYRDVLTAALQIDPSAVVHAVKAEIEDFEMPGAVMNDFRRMSVQIADAGIYDLRVHHDDIVWPLLRHLKLFDVTGLDAEAEQAREELGVFLDNLDKQATRYEDKRAQRHARAAERNGG
jgi:acyl-[acyl-carrier-protein] desaturase